MRKQKHRAYINRDRLPVIVMVISVAVVLLSLFLLSLSKQSVSDDIYQLSAKTKDGAIVLSWQNPRMSLRSKVVVGIESEEADLSITLPFYVSSYEFSDGVHGERYTFTVAVKDKEGNLSDGQEKQAMFLNWDLLPDLPLLSIETADDEEPTCELDNKPEWCVGVGITGNEYVRGRLSIVDGGETRVNTEMKFRIRGNTPTRLKTPYKIKLDRAMDLFARDDEIYQSKDWALLSYGTDLVLPTGLYVSEICGFEWQPKYEYVNLMVNGDWRGCYLLAEMVEKGEGRLNVGDEGFIIENDAYWWTAGSVYFKTDLIQNEKHPEMGYTFKYPVVEDPSDEIVTRVKKYMDDFEAKLYGGDESYADYIDIESFANWLLLQDVMGSWDGSGTNMFLYKDDFDEENPTSTKLKMGPAWDLESSCTEEYLTKWATVHETNVMYFKQLMTYADFRNTYKERWRAISAGLSSKVDAYVSEFVKEKGEALSGSWELDAKRWEYEIANVDEQEKRLSDWFSARVERLDKSIEELQGSSREDE